MCHLDKIEANDTHWFPRECCKNHKAFGKREAGLFKLEAEGEEMIALCSKTYVLKQGQKCKLTCKGINKNCVKNPLPIFQQVLENKTTFSAPEPNRGFRAKDNTMFTYTQRRDGFGYFYCKREVCEDGVNTNPIDMILSPWPDYNVSIFSEKHPLSNSYYQPIMKNARQFHCIDQAFAYEKAIHHNESEISREVLECENGIDCIKLVKDIKLNEMWYDRIIEVMTNLLQLKFNRCKQFRNQLLNSGNKMFVNANKCDKFWGCGLDSTIAELTSPKKYPGQNQLGLLLSDLRNSHPK